MNGKIMRAIVAGLAVMLAACGGGGGSAPAKPAAKTAKSRVTIYLDGDSTNHGIDADYANDQSPMTPAMLMQADFDKSLPGLVTVVDGSIPGSAFEYDLQGGGTVTVPLATRLSKLKTPADIVISNSEINDQYLLGETPTVYASWELQWIQTVRAANATPILEEPNPICRQDYNIPLTDDFVTTTRTLGQQNNAAVLPVYDAIKNYPLWNIKLMSADCVHPGDAGYAFKEASYFAALLPIVKQMLAK